MSFYWIPDGNNGSSDNYVLQYTVNGVTVSVTFAVAAPTISAIDPEFADAFIGNVTGNLNSAARITATITPPPSYSGTISWVQVLTNPGSVVFSGPSVETQTCSFSGPPLLDGTSPYQPTTPGNTSVFNDTPSVGLNSAQLLGYTSVTRQQSFSTYLMWQSTLAGSFAVPLWTDNWAITQDAVMIVLFVWAPSGTTTGTVQTATYPTWTAPGALQCGVAVGQ